MKVQFVTKGKWSWLSCTLLGWWFVYNCVFINAFPCYLVFGQLGSLLFKGRKRTVTTIFSSLTLEPPGVDTGVLSIFEAGVPGFFTVILIYRSKVLPVRGSQRRCKSTLVKVSPVVWSAVKTPEVLNQIKSAYGLIKISTSKRKAKMKTMKPTEFFA